MDKKCVIVRNDCEWFVADVLRNNGASYTKEISKAKIFDDVSAATRDCCVNEHVRFLIEFFDSMNVK
jgi:hypothetical protein